MSADKAQGQIIVTLVPEDQTPGRKWSLKFVRTTILSSYGILINNPGRALVLEFPTKRDTQSFLVRANKYELLDGNRGSLLPRDIKMDIIPVDNPCVLVLRLNNTRDTGGFGEPMNISIKFPKGTLIDENDVPKPKKAAMRSEEAAQKIRGIIGQLRGSPGKALALTLSSKDFSGANGREITPAEASKELDRLIAKMRFVQDHRLLPNYRKAGLKKPPRELFLPELVGEDVTLNIQRRNYLKIDKFEIVFSLKKGTSQT